MRVMGVDPACSKPIAWAVVENGVLMYSGRGTVIDLYGALRRDVEVKLVAVEDQYLFKNYKTAKKLSWAAGEAMGAAKIAGVRVAVANVSAWKAKMESPQGEHVERAFKLLGVELQDDEASAALIALYAEKYLTE